MAKVHTAHRVGTGDNQWDAGLAPGRPDKILSGRGNDVGIGDVMRLATTTLVPRLVPTFVAPGFLFQPVYWSLCFGSFFCLHPDSRRLWIAVGGQRPVTAQIFKGIDDLLASSAGDGALRSIILTGCFNQHHETTPA